MKLPVAWKRLATLYCGAVVCVAAVVGALGFAAIVGIGWPASVHALQGAVILAGLPAFIRIAVAGWRRGWWRRRSRVRLPIDRRARYVVGAIWAVAVVSVALAIVAGRNGKSHLCGDKYCNYVFRSDGVSEVVISPTAYLMDQAGGLIFLSAWSAGLNVAAIALLSSEGPRPSANDAGAPITA